MSLALGKRRRLSLLADYDGRFQLLDLRGPGAARAEAAALLSTQATAAVLEWADLPVALQLDRGAALVLAVDDPAAGAPALAAPDAVAAAARAGAAGVLVRCAWPADDGALAFLGQVGDEAAKHELPLLVEVRARGEAVAAAAALSAGEAQVDLLLLPLPTPLAAVREYVGLLGGEGEPELDRAGLEAALAAVDAAARVPWLLSGEAPAEAWLAALPLAAAAGASGFGCGGASWADVPAEGAEAWLAEVGVQRWHQALAAAERARPWTARAAE